MHKADNIYLAFDFGMRRIGIAVGQGITRTAQPLCIILADKGEPKWTEIQSLIEQWQANALVVGIPLNMDGTEQPIGQYAKSFAESLRHKFNLPVYEADERLSTIEARAQIFSTKIDKKRNPLSRTKKVDAQAAKVILEAWLNQQE